MKLMVDDKLYAFEATKDGGLAINQLPSNASLPALLPKGTYEKEIKVTTPWGETAFFLAISLIIMGVGFLKPNISALVGQLYDHHDQRRDSDFSSIISGSIWDHFGPPYCAA